jgi:DNA adenine methylase
MKQLSLFADFEVQISEKPVNVASVAQRSPFRYPGGKTWFVPHFRRWLLKYGTKPKNLIEPFAGGGIISLTAAFDKLTEKIIMVELDDQVAAVWETILSGDAEWLVRKILSFQLNAESAQGAVSQRVNSRREIAFQTILKNRIAHGGILAEGAGVIKNGENGRGIQSRWYPKTIAQRIRNIQYVSDRIVFLNGDAFEIIPKYTQNQDTVFFIDPPYTAGGKRAGQRLYKHYDIDHRRLFELCQSIKGDFIMTYDISDEVKHLAEQYHFQTRQIAMTNTHHAEMNELLIGKNLDWYDDVL